MEQLDAAISAFAPDAFALLEDLVRADSTIGNEAAAQQVLATALHDLDFAVEHLPVPESIADDPVAGVPQRSYAGRADLVGRRPGAGGQAPTLLINGHMDVVPAEDAGGWTSPPFVPTTRDGWMVGRGAGDMKCGFAMGVLALRALDAVRPGWQRGDLTVLAVIEEECTGNGTLAAGRAGVLADAAVLLECTNLELLLAGISIVWIEIEVDGDAGHAEASGSSVNPILAAAAVVEGLRRLEQRMNNQHRSAQGDPVFVDVDAPYAVNVGRFTSGSWASSVPEVARLEVRVGHPAAWTAERTLDEVRLAVIEASGDDPWLTEHPPRFWLSGYRAERYAQDPAHPLVQGMIRAHQAAHGSTPPTIAMGSTTDARYYLNQFDMPALAYGPRVRNIHGVDEAVELSSIVDGARTLVRFLLDYYGEVGS